MFLEEMGSASNNDVLICSFIICIIYIGTLLLRAVHAYRKSIMDIHTNSVSE
jgi:hypothetical protein